MDATTPHLDPIAAFNAELAAAKLGALQILQNLIHGLTDPAAPLSASLRELRLLATAILRTQPMKPPPAPTTAASAPDPPAPPPTPRPPSKPAANPTIFNPVRRAAINDVRTLISQGNRAVIDAVLHADRAPPRAPPRRRAPVTAPNRAAGCATPSVDANQHNS